MEFRFRLPEGKTDITFDAARLAEAHPKLRELRSRMIEKARGNERLVDHELAFRFFESLNRFGDGYVREMSGILERIFQTRDELSALYDSAAKGGKVTADAVKARFDQLSADMARLKSPAKALEDAPSVDLAPEKTTPESKAGGQPAPDLDVWAGSGTEADFDALLDQVKNLEDEAEVPRVKDRRIDDRRVPGPPREPRDPAKKAEWKDKLAHWFGRRRNKLNLWDLVRRTGENFRASLRRTLNVIGKRISDHPKIHAVWEEARADVLRGRRPGIEIGRDEMLGKGDFSGKGSIYDKVRDRFWALVRDPKNIDARNIFEEAGLRFGDEPAPNLETTNPDVNPRDVKVSLDHSAEKAQGENWLKAVDADNLVFEFADPNTYREIWQVRHKARQ